MLHVLARRPIFRLTNIHVVVPLIRSKPQHVQTIKHKWTLDRFPATVEQINYMYLQSRRQLAAALRWQSAVPQFGSHLDRYLINIYPSQIVVRWRWWRPTPDVSGMTKSRLLQLTQHGWLVDELSTTSSCQNILLVNRVLQHINGARENWTNNILIKWLQNI